MSSPTYILAINCGSSSIKSKLYSVSETKGQPLTPVAEASVKGIAAKGQKIKIKVEWLDNSGHDVSEEGEEGDVVECKKHDLAGQLLLIIPLMHRSDVGSATLGHAQEILQRYR